MWGRSHLPPATYDLLTGSDGLLEQVIEYLAALVDPPRGILLRLFVPRPQLVVLVGDIQGGQDRQAQRLYRLRAFRNRPHLLIHELGQFPDVFRVELPAHLVFLIVNRDADRALSSCHVICLRRYALIRPSFPSPPGEGRGVRGTFEPTGRASTNYPAESGFVNNSICSTSFSIRLRTSSRSRRSAWSSFSSAAEPLEPSLESAFDRSSSRSTARFSAWACLKTSTALRSFFSSCSNLTWVTLTRNQFFSSSVCQLVSPSLATCHSSLVTALRSRMFNGSRVST